MKGLYRIIGSSESACILLLLENRKYIFNCGEGFQRFLTQHKVRLGAKLDHMFLTRSHWSCIGGLPGFLLTMVDSGMKRLSISAPQEFAKLWPETKDFFARTDFTLDFNSDLTPYEDEVIKICPIEFHPTSRGNVPLSSVVSYFCKAVDIRGKFRTDKADSLGVPLKKRNVLGRYLELVLEDGRVISPELVFDPKRIGSSVIVLECPSPEYIESVMNSSSLNEMIDNASEINCIFHLAPLEVLADVRYQEWIKRLFETKNPREGRQEHILCHKSVTEKPLTFCSFSEIHAGLCAANPSLFPTLWCSVGDKFSHNRIEKLNLNRELAIHPASPLLTFNIEPKRFLENVEMTRENRSAQIPGMLSNVLRAKESDTKITFVGTGCAIPSKYRNVTCMHMEIEGTGVLFDCGEGSFSQLLHMHGYPSVEAFENSPIFSIPSDSHCESIRTLQDLPSKSIERTLLSLSLICISHMHADHHLGLITILANINRLSQCYRHLPNQIRYVIGPPPLWTWITAYCTINHQLEILNNINFIPAEANAKIDNFDIPVLSYAECVPVFHCPLAFGYVVQSVKGFKVVFSGDTRPVNSLIKAGLHADVLIHEATFDSTMRKEAEAKFHSTVEEAFTVASKMKVKNLFLTHFSQRYPGADASEKGDAVERDALKLFVWNPKKMKFPFSWAYAFDGMQWSSSMDQEFMSKSQEAVDTVISLLESIKVKEQAPRLEQIAGLSRARE